VSNVLGVNITKTETFLLIILKKFDFLIIFFTILLPNLRNIPVNNYFDVLKYVKIFFNIPY